MAKFQFNGMKEYVEYLQRIGANTKEICGVGVYAMAEVVANKIRENLDALPTVDEAEAVASYRGKKKANLTSSQKKGLQKGLGVSPMENDNGYWNVKVGFDGYNKVKTRKYPNGQPNVMIARATESGSSVREKTPFVRTAVTAATKPAIQAGQAAIDEKIKEKEG